MPKKRQKNGRRRQGGKGRPFTKDDPRPGPGRPPLTLEDKAFKELCRSKAPEAVERIEQMSKGKGLVAYKANEYLVDRGYGRPKQETDVNVSSNGGGLVVMLPPVNPEE